MRVSETIQNWYEVQRNLYIEVARKLLTLKIFNKQLLLISQRTP